MEALGAVGRGAARGVCREPLRGDPSLQRPDLATHLQRHEAGLGGIWGSGPEDIFAVGNNGTILHYAEHDE